MMPNRSASPGRVSIATLLRFMVYRKWTAAQISLSLSHPTLRTRWWEPLCLDSSPKICLISEWSVYNLPPPPPLKTITAHISHKTDTKNKRLHQRWNAYIVPNAENRPRKVQVSLFVYIGATRLVALRETCKCESTNWMLIVIIEQKWQNEFYSSVLFCCYVSCV